MYLQEISSLMPCRTMIHGCASDKDSLRQALQVALELESHQLASRQQQKVVREVRLDGETCDTEVRQPGQRSHPVEN